MKINNPEQPIVIQDLTGEVNFFGALGKKFAERLIAQGYEYEEAAGLVRILGFAANMALQESLYPNNGEQFRDENGRILLNKVPDVSLLIRHSYQEWGRNQMQVASEGWDALDVIKPESGGMQGRFVVSRDDNSYCDGVVIPVGFYDAYDPSTGVMVVDGDGEAHDSYGQMVEVKGVW